MTNNIRIERMTLEDTSVYSMELEVFEDAAWALKTFKEFVNAPYGYFFKAYWGDELAGFCSMYHNTLYTQNYCKIMDLRVKPAFRRKGIAKALMLEMLGLAKDLGLDRAKLEVDTKNSAVKLYKSLGFQIEDTEEGFYDDGADAYIMWRYGSI